MERPIFHLFLVLIFSYLPLSSQVFHLINLLSFSPQISFFLFSSLDSTHFSFSKQVDLLSPNPVRSSRSIPSVVLQKSTPPLSLDPTITGKPPTWPLGWRGGLPKSSNKHDCSFPSGMFTPSYSKTFGCVHLHHHSMIVSNIRGHWFVNVFPIIVSSHNYGRCFSRSCPFSVLLRDVVIDGSHSYEFDRPVFEQHCHVFKQKKVANQGLA